jgi:hypothetical protein
MDATANVCDNSDSDLSNFFSRPIKVKTYDWAVGGSVFQKFNPWKEFFENPRVINRIANYNLLRAKLKVKILLNGNGFHYGRAICSYIPLKSVDQFTVDRSFFSEDIIEASQRPHVYLDPTKSQGGTLALPYFWYKNYLSVPEMEWREMGECIIHTINNLKHANDATDNITISVFVWAEDVHLSIPTVAEPGAIVAQSGLEPQAGDEYGHSPVSAPAAALARWAGALSTAPVIGAYARATELAANAVAGVAKIFGYSRPAVLDPIVPYRPAYLGNLANTNVPDSTTSLAVDAKQELTCDTRTFGLDGTDEMTIKSIACRESYLTTFDWAVSDLADTQLWNSEVNPVKFDTVGTPREHHLTACAFAAMPFRFWRGTMKFRFQVVASQFHKGRLRVVYEPKTTLSSEYNTNYTYVLDLASERDFTVDIGWGVPKAYLETRVLTDNVRFGKSDITGFSDNYGNGIIKVYVVNELTVPNSVADNDIAINVFVSMGDDFEVAVPDSLNVANVSYYEPQSGFEPQSGIEMSADADSTQMESAPMSMNTDETMATGLSQSDATQMVYFADPIPSFRQMLKRYNFHNVDATRGNSTAGQPVHYRVTTPNFPYYRGYSPGGVDTTDQPSGGTPYNYCATTLMNYLTPAFTGWRGAIRYKLMVGNGADAGGLLYASRFGTRVAGNHARFEADMPDPTTALGIQRTRAFYDRTPALAQGHSGMHATQMTQNPCLEFEVPFYANRRFTPAKRNKVEADPLHNYHQYGYEFTPSPSKTGNILRWVAAGEDFTLGFYTGPPIIYVTNSPVS